MIRLISLVLILICFCLNFTGCEAFRRKFVRKPKGEREIKVVVETREYKSIYSNEQKYKKYFLFWRTTHDELVNLLDAQDGNRKKVISFAKKIVENLQQLRQLLEPEKQIRLDVFISEQQDIAREMDEFRLSRVQRLRIKGRLKKQRILIQKEFSFKNIQEYLVKE